MVLKQVNIYHSKIKINLSLTLHAKLTQMLNMKHKTINLIEIHIGDNICDLGKDFLYLTHKTQFIN